MRAYLEIYRLANDIVTTSAPEEEECGCDFGCAIDFDQLAE